MSNQAELLTLHGRLVAGDIRVAHRIVENALLPLIGIVGQRIPMRDIGDVEQACIDALLKYLQSPSSYDPSRAQLLTYLAAIAKGKLLTANRSNVRRLVRDGKYLNEQTMLGSAGDDAAEEELDLGSMDATHRLELIKDPGDEQILQFIAAGEHEPSKLARLLELPNDAGAEVDAKRRLERMRGRLRRLKTKIGA